MSISLVHARAIERATCKAPPNANESSASEFDKMRGVAASLSAGGSTKTPETRLVPIIDDLNARKSPANVFSVVWNYLFNRDLAHFKRYTNKSGADLRGLFTYPSLSRGLNQRRKDEESLRDIQIKANKASLDGDRVEMARIAEDISRICYGRGFRAQDRQSHLER